MKKVLTIAGSDSSGGAGIQADIKTITEHGMYAMSAITALTAQNTKEVTAILEATPKFVEAELDAVFTDIYPDSVKIGMVSNGEIIKSIAKKLKNYGAKKIVLDPVMISTSGCRLIKKEAQEVLLKELLPLADLITPNIPEAEQICGFLIRTKADMERAAEKIAEIYPTAVLIKGGHLVNDATDYLYEKGKGCWFVGERIPNPNTHGTGCTLSSAIACQMARGKTMQTSVQLAKEYLTGALRANLNLGEGSGPLNHMWQQTLCTEESDREFDQTVARR